MFCRKQVVSVDLIRIGKIVNTRGVRGELKMLSETSFKDERFLSSRPVFIDTDGEKRPYNITSLREFKGYDTILIEGYEDINKAEKFVGKTIWAENVDLDLNDDEFHIKTLIGMKVLQSDAEKGIVKDVIPYPQGDYLDVRLLTGEKKKIPFNDVFVLHVDKKKNTIDIVDMEGLL